MDKVKIIIFCMLDCIDGSFMSIVSGRRPQKSRPHQEGAWIQGTYFSVTTTSHMTREYSNTLLEHAWIQETIFSLTKTSLF